MKKYMVSYQYVGHSSGGCGNKTGTLEEITTYAQSNRSQWKSFSFFECMPFDGILSELKQIELSI